MTELAKIEFFLRLATLDELRKALRDTVKP